MGDQPIGGDARLGVPRAFKMRSEAQWSPREEGTAEGSVSALAHPLPNQRRALSSSPSGRIRAVVIEATGTATRSADDLDVELDVVARLPSHTGLTTLVGLLAYWRPKYLLLKAPLESVDYTALAACIARHVQVMVLARPEYGLLGSSPARRFGGLPWLRLRWRHRHRISRAVKRATDIGVVLLVAALLLPLLLAMAIPLSVGGTPLYVQKRVGRRGRYFNIVKLRTMRVNAESESGPILATPDDPRLTRTGMLLRRFRIDELPQLWNVLRGDMSLVGPRPERPEFVAEFRRLPGYDLRHLLRPGITGIAQLTGGYGAGVAEKLRCDLLYVSCWSWWLDVKLIVLTMRELLRGFPRG
jgi:lipopolysaccharide/colanic/teichoic acid biosynthesis glycosyltransferase